MPNGRCRMHGGASLRGMDSPTFKTGRYSRSIPDHLADRYRASLEDEERHDLRDEIAVAEAKVAECLYRMSVDPGDSDTLWIKLRNLEREIRRSDKVQGKQLLALLLQTIREGGEAASASRELDAWIARKSRSVETDMRVAKDKQHFIRVEEFMAAMSAVLEVIRRNVEDDETRRRMGRELRAIAEGKTRDASGAGTVIPLRKPRPT
jgi:DNA primase large subunit